MPKKLKSSFWHIGINKTFEFQNKRDEEDPNTDWRAPRIDPKGSIEFKPLPDHHDPDFAELTYGEPWGRIDSLAPKDVAFFLESATSDEWKTWSYYVVAYFVVEIVYKYKYGKWFPSLNSIDHEERIKRNAHQLRGDTSYSILLGEIVSSRVIFDKPFRISLKQDPNGSVKRSLALEGNKQQTGYWWKRWFDDLKTQAFLELLNETLR